MKEVQIQKEGMEARILLQGAELIGLKNKGKEYMWQRKGSWNESSPVLFPVIGRLFQKGYTYQGTLYPMELHGFARKMNFDLVEQSEDKAVFVGKSDGKTQSCFPFSFTLWIIYKVSASNLEVRYVIENTGKERLYFDLGGHPGFQLPLEEGEAFSDYRLEFPEVEKGRRILFSQEGLTTEEEGEVFLEQGRLKLSKELFREDAIVFKEVGNQVCLKSEKKESGLVFQWEGFSYIGFWTTPKEEDKFLCVEPWTGLPGREGRVEALEEKASISLAAKEKFEAGWSVKML